MLEHWHDELLVGSICARVVSRNEELQVGDKLNERSHLDGGKLYSEGILVILSEEVRVVRNELDSLELGHGL
jgi:hypothetical protein